MPVKQLKVGFGADRDALTAVGVTILNPDLTVNVARYEGANIKNAGGGDYTYLATLPAKFRGLVKWDSGETPTPRVVTASINPVESDVWEEAGADHVAAGTMGLFAQPTTVIIASATASTVTLPTPWNTGNAAKRTIYANGQGRQLASHVGSGVYALDEDWTAPADLTPATIGGRAYSPANVWANAVRSLTDKTGFVLSATGLDAISVADFAGAANTIPKMIVRLWRRFFAPASKTSTQLRTFADDGTTVRTTQAVSDDGATETQGLAS